MRRLVLIMLACSSPMSFALAQTSDSTMVPQHQYAYVIKLIPRLLDEKNWTDRENGIIERHFQTLQKLQAEGKLLLAGRTLTTTPEGFGIVILNVASEAEARRLMENDDAVKEGIMTAQLFPFRVALKEKAEE